MEYFYVIKHNIHNRANLDNLWCMYNVIILASLQTLLCHTITVLCRPYFSHNCAVEYWSGAKIHWLIYRYIPWKLLSSTICIYLFLATCNVFSSLVYHTYLSVQLGALESGPVCSALQRLNAVSAIFVKLADTAFCICTAVSQWPL